MSNFGLPGFGDPQPLPPPPVRPPARRSDLDDMVALVDRMLNETKSRSLFSTSEVHNLLLDLRNVLDRLSAPAVLREIADQLDDSIPAGFFPPLPLPGE